MLNEKQAQSMNLSFWQNMQKLLFGPHPTITEANAKREAHLISVISFLIAYSSLIGVISTIVMNGPSRNAVALLGIAFAGLAAYVLARTRFHRIGSYLIVWALVFVAFGMGDTSRLSISPHTVLVLAFLIASITFPFRYMLFFVILNNIIISLFPLIDPDSPGLSDILGLFIPISLIILVLVRHRDNMERDRLENNKQLNHELSKLKQEFEQATEQNTDQLDERNKQLHVVTEVARNAASFQDLDRLLTSSTRLISESLNYYHVGIFLMDEDGQYAVLRAANSEGGQRMLSRMHTLTVDLNSLVGYVAKTHTPRIAQDTGEDSVHFNNPDLPETRSEMALPLKVGMKLIGILDVQSTQKYAFKDEQISILGTVVDQLAVAIENTRLLSETRRALLSAEQTYQRYFRQAWSQFAHRVDIEGYRYHNGKIYPVNENADKYHTEVNADSKLSIPLVVRGQDIGYLEIQPINGKRSWNSNEIAILEAAAERAALALESARLLQDAQKRASKESIISEISARVSASTDIEEILRNVVLELGSKMGGAEVIVELGTE